MAWILSCSNDDSNKYQLYMFCASSERGGSYETQGCKHMVYNYNNNFVKQISYTKIKVYKLTYVANTITFAN